jgi:hypothetical protein
MSPEMLARESYTEKADIYSLTLVLWEILTARTPYETMQNKKELRHAVLVKRQRPLIPTGPGSNCHPLYKTLLERGWATNPSNRPTAKEMVQVLETILLEIDPDAAAVLAKAGSTRTSTGFSSERTNTSTSSGSGNGSGSGSGSGSGNSSANTMVRSPVPEFKAPTGAKVTRFASPAAAGGGPY